MTMKSIGIKNRSMVAVESSIVDCREVYCDSITIGIRDKSSNVRYVKRAMMPVEIDMELEQDICNATERVLTIVNETLEENMGKGLRAVSVLPIILSKVSAVCEAASGADKMREGFMTLIETATAITEPILWFYALAACILMATGKKGVGWEKLKNVGYSYILITMLPTLFQFCRWISKLILECIAVG